MNSKFQHPAIDLLTELLEIPSPSGWEDALATVVRQRLVAMGYTPETDGAGNVLVRLAGGTPDAPLVCYAAHMDEIGMTVHRVEPDGALRVERLGGLFPWKLGETPVQVLGDRGRIDGVLAMGAGHGSSGERALQWSDVRIITGCTGAQLEDAGVRPGSPAVPLRAARGPLVFGDPADPMVAAWTFDDRMGVVALLRLLADAQSAGWQPALPTIVAFTVQEEVGGMGAKVLAQREKPEVFIAVDGSPVTPDAPLALDGRPGIWTHDRLAPYDPRLVRAFAAAAIAAGTAVQPVAYAVSASDASMVFAAGAAARIACFGHVRENSHGFEVARLSVFDNVLHTLVHFARTWSG